jgi:hypothetical protein
MTLLPDVRACIADPVGLAARPAPEWAAAEAISTQQITGSTRRLMLPGGVRTEELRLGPWRMRRPIRKRIISWPRWLLRCDQARRPRR